jgi:hypothetical protein
MSMTSPKTNLTRGHCAPVAYRSSPVSLSTLPQADAFVFLRRDFRADPGWVPNKCIERMAGKRCLPVRFGLRPTPAAHAQRYAPGAPGWVSHGQVEVP